MGSIGPVCVHIGYVAGIYGSQCLGPVLEAHDSNFNAEAKSELCRASGFERTWNRKQALAF